MKLLYRLFGHEVFSSILLIISAIFAMVLANLRATQGLYHAFLNTPVELRIGALDINKNVTLWVNDALMAIFFLLIGIEIKQELIYGSLATLRRAALPIFGALGGMIVPSLTYLFFNYQNPLIRIGWAIPTATDIAFTLSIITLLGNLIPVALRVFLMTLAIVDDLGAIIIIALFYTRELSIISLGISSGMILVLALLNICNVHRIDIYILVGVILWTALLKSGIHATLAGVIIGFFIPIKHILIDTSYPAKQIEHILRPWVKFIVLPLFAFTNAGVSFHGMMLNNFTSTLLFGIIAGLLIGKPLGISLFCWLSIKLKLASMTGEETFQQIIAIGMLCGVGFTMSIFIANIAFGSINPQLVVWAKISIIISSLVAAFIGYALLKVSSSRKVQTV